MTSRFVAKKKSILEQLDVPEDQYQDLSPKGSIDEPIRPLISDINRLDGLVTTSSCSGRISVFLEGKRKDARGAKAGIVEVMGQAGPGGKGGGQWLFVSHSPIATPFGASDSSFMSVFGLKCHPQPRYPESGLLHSHIHIKFEPMILHILTASLQDAQDVLSAAMSAGFRESGALSITPSKTGEVNPMVAVRSTGYSFDAVIGYRDEHDENIAIVDEQYLRTLVKTANERFDINTERILRFRSLLLRRFEQNRPRLDPTSISHNENRTETGWEDPETRKLRKREEGLRRQRALRDEALSKSGESNETDQTAVSLSGIFN